MFVNPQTIWLIPGLHENSTDFWCGFRLSYLTVYAWLINSILTMYYSLIYQCLCFSTLKYLFFFILIFRNLIIKLHSQSLHLKLVWSSQWCSSILIVTHSNRLKSWWWDHASSGKQHLQGRRLGDWACPLCLQIWPCNMIGLTMCWRSHMPSLHTRYYRMSPAYWSSPESTFSSEEPWIILVCIYLSSAHNMFGGRNFT